MHYAVDLSVVRVTSIVKCTQNSRKRIIIVSANISHVNLKQWQAAVMKVTNLRAIENAVLICTDANEK